MSKITNEQYELALARIEELLPMVDENTPLTDRNAVELSLMSDIVIEYEKEHYPIEKATKSVSIGMKKASHNAVGLLFLSSIRINWLILQIGVDNTIYLLKKSIIR